MTLELHSLEAFGHNRRRCALGVKGKRTFAYVAERPFPDGQTVSEIFYKADAWA
jgi:hypothetical protein